MTSQLSTTQLGYVTDHGPTVVDYAYAADYARNRLQKEICDSNPDRWQWIEETCGYPCPWTDQSNCVCGYCTFTETGCADYSYYPYFDCARETKDCKIDGVEKDCSMCVYEPCLIPETFGIDVHHAYGPTIAPDGADDYTFEEGGSCDNRNACYPGDSLNTDSCDDATDSNLSCAPIKTYEPYNMLSSVVCYPDDDSGKTGKCTPTDDEDDLTGYCSSTDPDIEGRCYKQITNCRPDEDGDHTSTFCSLVGLGGSCSSTDTEVDGYCYDADHGYTEWRDDFQQWEDSGPRGTCVAVIPEYRRWCEMPWTRPGINESDADLIAENSYDLDTRINKQWKTRWRQPFYYDPSSGDCYVTHDYCSKSVVTEGGYDQSYGHGDDYVVYTTCNKSDYFVESGKDCCTGIWQSLAQFFFGKTIVADFKNLVEGKITPWEFAKISNENYAMLTFFSDSSLKNIKKIEIEDFVAPGIHLYNFEWTPEAQKLYNLTGESVGVMAEDIRTLYPDHVSENENGHLVVMLDPALLLTDAVYLNIMVALRDMENNATNAEDNEDTVKF